jgi:hypothetical protein
MATVIGRTSPEGPAATERPGLPGRVVYTGGPPQSDPRRLIPAPCWLVLERGTIAQ